MTVHAVDPAAARDDGPGAVVLNFAYGSNLLLRRLRERVPSARVLGRAQLPGHALRWHKRSRDGSTKCDVVAQIGSVVWGVVVAIPAAEKPVLDAAEGLGAGYAEHVVEVVPVEPAPADPTPSATTIACRAYVATDVDPIGLPYAWYRALVVAGAREHGLPASYIAALEAQPVQDDPDLARDARHRAFLR